MWRYSDNCDKYTGDKCADIGIHVVTIWGNYTGNTCGDRMITAIIHG